MHWGSSCRLMTISSPFLSSLSVLGDLVLLLLVCKRKPWYQSETFLHCHSALEKEINWKRTGCFFNQGDIRALFSLSFLNQNWTYCQYRCYGYGNKTLISYQKWSLVWNLHDCIFTTAQNQNTSGWGESSTQCLYCMINLIHSGYHYWSLLIFLES